MKIAVLLSGSGFLDGAEIHESVLSLLALSKAGVTYQCVAPDTPQYHVVDHLTGQVSAERRNVLTESARIARGNILALNAVDPADYAGLIIPGGYGAAKNLCDFAQSGANCVVQPQVLAFAKAIAAANKPIVFICIAPALIPAIYGPGAQLTIGSDPATAQTLETMGASHSPCPVTDIVIDESRKIISTPAYMLANSIAEAALGIEKAIAELLRLAKPNQAGQ